MACSKAAPLQRCVVKLSIHWLKLCLTKERRPEFGCPIIQSRFFVGKVGPEELGIFCADRLDGEDVGYPIVITLLARANMFVVCSLDRCAFTSMPGAVSADTALQKVPRRALCLFVGLAPGLTAITP